MSLTLSAGVGRRRVEAPVELLGRLEEGEERATGSGRRRGPRRTRRGRGTPRSPSEPRLSTSMPVVASTRRSRSSSGSPSGAAGRRSSAASRAKRARASGGVRRLRRAARAPRTATRPRPGRRPRRRPPRRVRRRPPDRRARPRRRLARPGAYEVGGPASEQGEVARPDPPARAGEQPQQRRVGSRLVEHLEHGHEVGHLRQGRAGRRARRPRPAARGPRGPRAAARSRCGPRTSTATSRGVVLARCRRGRTISSAIQASLLRGRRPQRARGGAPRSLDAGARHQLGQAVRGAHAASTTARWRGSAGGRRSGCSAGG